MINKITESLYYIGADDHSQPLFENQYVVEEGMSYNSYLIVDEKIAIMDTADKVVLDRWLENLDEALAGRTPDYVIVTHMEPDHSAGLARLIELYPQIKIVGNAKTFMMIGQFFGVDISEREVAVKDGDLLELGEHTLRFIMTPMVHWPEVMMVYDMCDKSLFSADGFGKFGALDSQSEEEGWSCEARRYYYNIVGKYGANVQGALKKLAGVEISRIAPLHGPVLSGDLSEYLKFYDMWSRYQYEDKGVMVAYATIHGNTREAAERMAELLREAGAECVRVCETTCADQSFLIEDAFQTENLVVMAPSYDAGLFPPMEHFLHHLKSKNYQGRKVGIIENGSWAPSAGKVMRAQLETMKGLDIYEQTITIKSSLKEENIAEMKGMVEWLLN